MCYNNVLVMNDSLMMSENVASGYVICKIVRELKEKSLYHNECQPSSKEVQKTYRQFFQCMVHKGSIKALKI